MLNVSTPFLVLTISYVSFIIRSYFNRLANMQADLVMRPLGGTIDPNVMENISKVTWVFMEREKAWEIP